MNKQELSALVAEILGQMKLPEPAVKGSDYRNTAPEPEKPDKGYHAGDFVPDVTELNLRKLYLTEDPADPEGFLRLKEKTPPDWAAERPAPGTKP